MSSSADPSFVPPLPPLAAFAGAPLYVTGDDNLLVTVKNAAAGVTITIGGRTLAVGDADASPFGPTIVPATDRSDSTIVIPLTSGWLVSVQAKVTAGSPLSGQTWVRFSLIHGQSASSPELFTLCSGYVTAKKPLSYPGGSLVDSLDGAGALRSIIGATPGAGAEVSETVPTGARWDLIAFRFRLASAVAAANRFVDLLLDDGGAIPYAHLYPVATAQVASFTFDYTFGHGLPNTTGQQAYMGPLPNDLRMGAGHRIRSSTLGLQAADQFSQVQYLLREWIEGS